ncbi:MAG: hypothetical protein HGA84_01610, partial [Syntrophobacteraceae bacterium]|nr:hypothetical protein [Syntrophobacteraceae bacterium]
MTTRHKVVAAKLAGCAMLMMALLAFGCDRAERDGSLTKQQLAVPSIVKTGAVAVTKKTEKELEIVTPAAARAQALETREARMASVKLAEQVDKLRRELEDSRVRIDDLTEQLARAKLESDKIDVEPT